MPHIPPLDKICDAKSAFPAGLLQPPGSFRFGVDALLLASFAANCLAEQFADASVIKVCELGCGCGAALLALAMQSSAVTGLGMDIEPRLVDAARINGANLGLEQRLQWLQADVREELSRERSDAGAYDLVMANPPWLEKRRGKASQSLIRERAIVGGPGILEAFCGYAARLMRPDGLLCMILPDEWPERFKQTCRQLGMGSGWSRPILSFAGDKPARVFAAAGSCGDSLETRPLVLHERCNGRAIWSGEALEFCHWLKR